MSFSLKVKNPGKLTARLLRRSAKFRASVIRNYTLGADRFITDIREKYYMGQKGDIGVNRISKNLHRRWLPVVIDQGDNIIARVSNEMNYAEIHEFGSGIHEKRTFVTEEIMGGSGQEIFTEAAQIALKEAF